MIKYAKDKEGNIFSIKTAAKKTDYFIDGRVYIARKGEINKHHFALKAGGGNGKLGHFVCNESVEHYNHKMFIEYSKKIKVDGIEIIASSSASEVGLNGRVIDVVYYSQDGSIICLIEVVKNHDLTESKIEDLKDYNIVRYETNNNSPRIKLLPRSEGAEIKSNLEKEINNKGFRTRRGKSKISKIKKAIKHIEENRGNLENETYDRFSERDRELREEIREENKKRGVVNAIKEELGRYRYGELGRYNYGEYKRDEYRVRELYKEVKSCFINEAIKIQKNSKAECKRIESEIKWSERKLEELREGIKTIPDLERKIQILEK
tara:strand:+ start:115 stop:1077 length:963 start_codon:yes stop_codon:yes gene_type:complete